jgi:polyphosphate kinase 2 (PPK2 family)
MFEAAELGRSTSKADYKARLPALRADLLALQRRLRDAGFPVVVVFAGVDGAGKSETVNLLNEWMDPRWIVTRAYGDPSDEERERPEFWRYWRDLPPRGRVGLFLSSWYSRPVLDRVYRRSGRAEFDQRLARITEFERMLADDGALILKFWMHLGRKQQKKRLEALESDTLTRWRVTNRQWKHWRMYGRFIAAAEQAIRLTSTASAPWTIVEGLDPRYRSLAVADTLAGAIRRRLDLMPAPAAPRSAITVPATRDASAANAGAESAGAKSRRTSAHAAAATKAGGQTPTILSRLDMSLTASPRTFDARLEELQGRLNRLHRKAQDRGLSTVLVFEGWDAAGKGGAIRRVMAALDARGGQVIPIAAPTDEERAHHYLWRFWRHLSRAGRVTIFDRSWYGRVLVERVEGFASEAEWFRAYAEINQFEQQLVEHGVVLVKYWVHITSAEQLRRFKERAQTAHKQWKLTEEDWRNRERWDAYEQAVNDMIERTSTKLAPWTLVEGNDKRYARLKVLETVVARLEGVMT